jgi:hypothetical protein
MRIIAISKYEFDHHREMARLAIIVTTMVTVVSINDQGLDKEERSQMKA